MRRKHLVVGVMFIAVAIGLLTAVRSQVIGSERKIAEPAALTDISRAALDHLRSDSKEPVEVSSMANSSRPGSLLMRLPSETKTDHVVTSDAERARAVVDRYRDLFGVHDTASELVDLGESKNSRSTSRKFLQVANGIEVLGGGIAVHFDSRTGDAVGITNSIVPLSGLGDAAPRIDPQNLANTIVEQAPGLEITRSPRLVVYTGMDADFQRVSPHFAWVLQAADKKHVALYLIVVDAITGKVEKIADQVSADRDRLVLDAQNDTQIPGSKVARKEGDTASTDGEANAIYDELGRTYDYFSSSYGRNGVDGADRRLAATIRLGSEEKGEVKPLKNAFWYPEPINQMMYGADFHSVDITAHELTHGITRSTAELSAYWQSGALNESYSDIFGELVEGSDDWVHGAKSLGGTRNLEDPHKSSGCSYGFWHRFDDRSFCQAESMNEWRKTDLDNCASHLNSTIHSRAFVLVAEAIGKEKAGLIFYRTLTNWLPSNATFEDSRTGALFASRLEYGIDSTEERAVRAAFDKVGLDGDRQPPRDECHPEEVISSSQFHINPAAAAYVCTTVPSSCYAIDLRGTGLGVVQFETEETATRQRLEKMLGTPDEETVAPRASCGTPNRKGVRWKNLTVYFDQLPSENAPIGSRFVAWELTTGRYGEPRLDLTSRDGVLRLQRPIAEVQADRAMTLADVQVGLQEFATPAGLTGGGVVYGEAGGGNITRLSGYQSPGCMPNIEMKRLQEIAVSIDDARGLSNEPVTPGVNESLPVLDESFERECAAVQAQGNEIDQRTPSAQEREVETDFDIGQFASVRSNVWSGPPDTDKSELHDMWNKLEGCLSRAIAKADYDDVTVKVNPWQDNLQMLPRGACDIAISRRLDVEVRAVNGRRITIEYDFVLLGEPTTGVLISLHHFTSTNIPEIVVPVVSGKAKETLTTKVASRMGCEMNDLEGVD